MKEIKWLIEDFEDDNSFGLLADEVKRQGMECKVLKYEPFESGSYNCYDDDDCVVFQGSLNLAQQLQKEKNWNPGPIATFKHFDCTHYYAYWGRHLFNDNYVMMPLAELKRNIRLVQYYFRDQELFIRPSDGLKSFNGQVLDQKNWSTIDFYSKPHTLAVISSKKNIRHEWRFVVVDKKVITGSQYGKKMSTGYEKIYGKAAFDFAQKIASSDFEPDIAYVLDICSNNTGLYLLEAGAFSCSGLYKCDMEKIVTAITEVVRKRVLKEC